MIWASDCFAIMMSREIVHNMCIEKSESSIPFKPSLQKLISQEVENVRLHIPNL